MSKPNRPPRPGGRMFGPDCPSYVQVDRKLGDWIKRRKRMMAEGARKEVRTIHGQEVEVTVLPMADVTGEFPYRPNVKETNRNRRMPYFRVSRED